MDKSNTSAPPATCSVDATGALSCQLASDEALFAAGWERRFIAEPQRAEEMADMYRELGFATRLEPVRLINLKNECAACQVVFEKFLAVYTKKDLK
ncbi:MAG: hypothetical protein D6814_18175 [Calditrichaeota bacterium]|nr:MAG: hypothetical protein D6814_18175 [Calditrichota bacterium]